MRIKHCVIHLYIWLNFFVSQYKFLINFGVNINHCWCRFNATHTVDIILNEFHHGHEIWLEMDIEHKVYLEI